MTIEVTQNELDQISAYIFEKKGVVVKIDLPDNPFRINLYSLALDAAQKYFRGHGR